MKERKSRVVVVEREPFSLMSLKRTPQQDPTRTLKETDSVITSNQCAHIALLSFCSHLKARRFCLTAIDNLLITKLDKPAKETAKVT